MRPAPAGIALPAREAVALADVRVALAAAAAIIGAGFASGRELAAFFVAHGNGCWLGAVLCSAAAGAGTALLVRLARRTQAETLPRLYALVMDERCGEAVQIAYTLLLLILAGAMVSAAGELGALALSSRYARAAGMALGLAAAMQASRSPRVLAATGAFTAAATAGYYTWLLLAVPRAGSATAGESSFAAAGAMGVLYAALNLTIAGGVICAAGRRAASPLRAGLWTGGLLLALLVPACAAIARAGDLSPALPSVAMAAKMGAAGFWASLGVMACAVASTLGAALYCLREQLRLAGLPEAACLPAAALGALLLSSVGFAPIVDVVYPLLGFLCAILLPALAVFL